MNRMANEQSVTVKQNDQGVGVLKGVLTLKEGIEKIQFAKEMGGLNGFGP